MYQTQINKSQTQTSKIHLQRPTVEKRRKVLIYQKSHEKCIRMMI